MNFGIFNNYSLGNCKRLFFGYVAAKPVDGLKLVLKTDRSTIIYGEMMDLTTTLIVRLNWKVNPDLN